MEEWVYVMLIKKTKEYRRLNKAKLTEHVENLQELDNAGKIELASAFKGYSGMAGMFVLKAESYEEAEAICKKEPLIVAGFATYELHRLQIASKENNYLL
ncbi:YciI family protein [Enterococcus sp. DIV0756]|uniref:YciI family protein n=1 Tax=Enterococcus sp. DIV0756 TaxID=2774636 RepID=UPI003F22B2DC